MVVANVRPEDASDISIGTEMTFMPVGADPRKPRWQGSDH
jgi:cobalt-zinc-cadmium efflux system membrane fusion protein